MSYLGVMSSKDWFVTVGTLPIRGLAEGSNIIIEMSDDHVAVTQGIGGDWSFVVNPSNGSSVTFTTQRTATASNGGLHRIQQSEAVLPVSLVNRRNLTTHVLAYAMCQRQPTDGANNGADAQTLEWTFLSGDTDSVII